jgi:hypothetical protein
MRTLLRVTIGNEAGNSAIQTGTLAKVMGEVFERIRPEATYFTTSSAGQRQALIVFDLKDPSDIPALCEPLFQKIGASIELEPVMTLDDLRKGLAAAH